MWLSELFFPQFCKLICRGTDISKYFRDSLGIRDKESRLIWVRNPACKENLHQVSRVRFRESKTDLSTPNSTSTDRAKAITLFHFSLLVVSYEVFVLSLFVLSVCPSPRI